MTITDSLEIGVFISKDPEVESGFINKEAHDRFVKNIFSISSYAKSLEETSDQE